MLQISLPLNNKLKAKQGKQPKKNHFVSQPRNKTKPKSMWLGMDFTLLTMFLGLLLFGLIMVTSASISIAEKELGDALYHGRRQFLYICIGLGMSFALLRTPMWLWEKSGFIMLALSLASLVAVLIIGHKVNGAQRWINLGFMTVQVSEMARLGLFIYMASYLVRHGDEVRSHLKGFIKPVAVMSLASILLLLEPDFGATVVLCASCMAMIFLAGAKLWQFAVSMGAAIAAFVVLIMLSPYRRLRFTGFMDPWENAFGSGYQLTQSLIAFGSGGWSGLGLGSSVQKLFYLPEAHNDFVFAIVGEELGLLGVICVLLAFIVLVARIVKVATKAMERNELFSAYLVFGIAFWIAMQSFINMGVSMGMLPTKGLTLPLMSAGGSAIMVACVAIGMVMRVNLENHLAGMQAQVKTKTKSKSQKSNKQKVTKKKAEDIFDAGISGLTQRTIVEGNGESSVQLNVENDLVDQLIFEDAKQSEPAINVSDLTFNDDLDQDLASVLDGLEDEGEKR